MTTCGPVRVAACMLPVFFAGCARTPRPRMQNDFFTGSRYATWEAAPQLTEDRNMPPVTLAGATLRQVLHVTLGGTNPRIRLSNEFGDEPLEVSSAYFAHSAGGDSTRESVKQFRFSNDTSVTIPPGTAMWSDAVDATVEPLTEVTISLHLSKVPRRLTGHPGSRTTSFIVSGSQAKARALPNPARTEHWYLISGLDVLIPAEHPSASVVVLGNSIADGRGSGTDKNDRWPDNLARRLQQNELTRNVGVLNAGIGGNAVLRGGLGPTAIDRFDRDVLDQQGARWVIVSEGVNDLGSARPDSALATAEQLIEAYKSLIARARRRGMSTYGATMLPFGGSFYDAPQREAARARINDWIRSSGAFKAVIDFDAALRDPANPSRLRRDADSGDHLHPNENGYRLMAEAIDLSLFRLDHQ